MSGALRTRPLASAGTRRSRFLLLAVLLSIGVHLLLALLIVLLPRVLPGEPRAAEQGTVELLMVEQKGSVAGAPGKPQESQPKKPQEAAAPQAEPVKPMPAKPVIAKPTPAKPEPAKPKSAKSDPNQSEQAKAEPAKNSPQPVPAPAAAQPEDAVAPPPEPAPVPAPPPPQDTVQTPEPQQTPETQQMSPDKMEPAQPQPETAAAEKAPVFNLEGTDSESNAVALGGHILPAKPDNRFRNRPPAYPLEAEMLHQHGEVVVVIHVNENGLASGVDVLESSGVQVLDQAAMAAVRKWRFHPAMKNGRTMPFDMPFRFVFEAK